MSETLVDPAPRSEANTIGYAHRPDKALQIIEGATKVFLEDGYSAASIEKIVEKARVSKRTLYKYYKGKVDLFIDVVRMQISETHKNLELTNSDTGDLSQQLRRVGVDALRAINSPIALALFRITAGEMQRFPKLVPQFLNESLDGMIAGIAALLEQESQKEGLHIKDARQASQYFLDLLLGVTYPRIIFGGIPPMNNKVIHERADMAVNYFFHTFKSP